MEGGVGVEVDFQKKSASLIGIHVWYRLSTESRSIRVCKCACLQVCMLARVHACKCACLQRFHPCIQCIEEHIACTHACIHAYMQFVGLTLPKALSIVFFGGPVKFRGIL